VETELQTLTVDNRTESFSVDLMLLREDLLKEGYIA
jgi:hypothetical protein